MSDSLRALPVAVADLAVGVTLAQYVSVSVGTGLAVVGVLVLLTVAYRAVQRGDRTPPRERQPA